MITNNLSTLDIHQLSEQQFQRIVENGEYDENALYLTSDKEVLIVTINGDTASHTAQQIYDHVQAGGATMLVREHYTYILVGCTANYATFDHCYDDDLHNNIVVGADGSVEFREFINLHTDNNYILTPTTAEVGQTIVVKSVDENGKPTTWEAVDLPKMGAFNFNGQGMVFELAMTWADFCDSPYNFMHFQYDDDGVYDEPGDPIAFDGYDYGEPALNEIEPCGRYTSL